MLIYLFVINTICFILMGYDKLMAIKGKSRIPETTLIALSFLGGSISTLIGMFIFNHKTKKIKFLILIPLSLIITIIFIIKDLRL